MRNFLLISGGNIFRQLCTFFAQILIAKRAGSAAFGELTLAFSIYFILAGLADFGCRFHCWQSVLREDKDNRKSTATHLLVLRSVFAFFVALASAITIWLVAEDRFSLLLYGYTFGIVFNQIAFDWYFLSLGRVRSLFVFNVSSGLFYLVFVSMYVKSSSDIIGVPIAFVFSYALPGLALIDFRKLIEKLGTQSFDKFLSLGKKALLLPRFSYKYALYDGLQRTYSMVIFPVAGMFYSLEAIGEFRLAHLMYTFISSLAIYLGTSLFNRIHSESSVASEKCLVPEGVGFICLLIVPLSLVGHQVITPLNYWIFSDSFTSTLDQAVTLMLAGLILPAASNFIREAVIPMQYTLLSAWSICVTITVTMIMLIVYHPNNILYIGVALLIGELAGIIFLIKCLPVPIMPKRWGRITSHIFGFIMLLIGVLYLVSLLLDPELLQIELLVNLITFGILYVSYVVYINRKFGAVFKSAER